jgi:hypothetical protein
MGDESVLVHDVKVLDNEMFSGRLHRLDPSHPLSHGGHNIEDIVDFEHSHILPYTFPQSRPARSSTMNCFWLGDTKSTPQFKSTVGLLLELLKPLFEP